MSTTPPIPTINTSDDITPGPFSEHELRTQWNAQADEFNQWESLDLSEQLAWAQARAIAADRTRAELAQPEPKSLPPGYIDAEHAGCDREMLEIFYKACRSEGGTADEIHLRGLRAVLALAQPEPEGPTDEEIEREAIANADTDDEYRAFKRGAFFVKERMNRPAIEPVPVSERPILKSSDFNDAEGRCWCGTTAFTDERGDLPIDYPMAWELRQPCAEDDCVVPHYAFPVPTRQEIL